ncbi:MAG: hypothetical protein BWY53_00350 [Parcubacteria group bacterium ADurb.Bin326]|nr:MAG: hypothetical protein BWY53_00350 [Parcubacteria group bacterium ADurb.Bin326]
MKNPISEKILNHLEFLGYQIAEKVDDEKYDLLVVTNENKSNLIVRIYKDNVVYVLARYKFEAIKNIPDIYKSINEVNFDSAITKWCYSKNQEDANVVTIEAFFNGYEKVAFGSFIDMVESEISKYIEKLKQEGLE